MDYKVVKRDGREVPFEVNKIVKAIRKAFDAKGQEADNLSKLALKVVVDFEEKIQNGRIGVEAIQDSVEAVLIDEGYAEVAKGYILYRDTHNRTRAANDALVSCRSIVDSYLKATDWRVKESSTVSYSIGGLILSNNAAVTANYWLNDIYDQEIGDAHKNADIHIHDLSILGGYCAGWSLKQLIQEGLGGVAGKVASSPPKHLTTLCNQMVNFLGIMQNEWAGAQAFSSFDTYLAPFVKVDNLSYKEVKQAIQSFVYGVNTPSRWGCVDTDTEVLSVNGFRRHDELKEGDEIYTWNNGALEINKVNKVISKPFKGNLHSYRVRDYDQTVTPNHRVLIKKHNRNEYDIKLSEEIFDAKTAYSMPSMFHSSNLSSADLSNDEIMLAAMIYTDGNIDMRNGSVHKVKFFKAPARWGNEDIAQVSKNLDLEYVKSEKIGGFGSAVNQYTFYGDSARKIVELVGETKEKIDSKFMRMDMEQAELFLSTWYKLDGCATKMKLQYDNDVVGDQLQQIALLGGYTSYKTSRRITNYIKLRKNKNVKPTDRVEVEYDGIVWCPNVDNGTAVFRKGGNIYISGQTQAPFSNITLDWVVPNDLANLPAIVGGKDMDFTYSECQAEMDIVNKAFLEIMIEGDAEGRGFAYPIPTYNITKSFDWGDTENNRLLFEMTSKYGTPYFSNYINSDMDPSDVRSMCPMIGGTHVLIKGEDSTPSVVAIDSLYSEEGKLYDVATPTGWAKGKPIRVPMTKVLHFVTDNSQTFNFGINHLQPTQRGVLRAEEMEIGDKVPFQTALNMPPQWATVIDIRELTIDESYLYCFEIESEDRLFTLANGLVTHNCRLRLDLRELRRKAGGFFGSGENTGSVGVVTINMPRLAYLAADEKEFFTNLGKLMDISARSLDTKRRVISQYLENGLYPYTKRYLKSYDNHFSTLGLVGMNEACLNAKWLGKNLVSEEAQEWTKKVLSFMRDRLSDYQEKYGNLFNLEATPAESTAFRFAKHDRKRFPQIITAAQKDTDTPYYTNSSHLPVGFTDDIFKALDIQDELQTLYTSGTVFHTFLGEKMPSWRAARNLVRIIAEKYKLPYYTLSPTYSVCGEHGYIVGEEPFCPTCGQSTEVYSRITGYYRPVQNWNDGKTQEFHDRNEYKEQKQLPILITTPTCPMCPLAKTLLDEAGIEYTVANAADVADLIKAHNITTAPTLIDTDGKVYVGVDAIKGYPIRREYNTIWTNKQ